jgi:hypothetical protein
MIRWLSTATVAALVAVAWDTVATADTPTAIAPAQRWQKEVLDADKGFDADAERAYFITPDGKLAACDLKTGAALWTVPVAGLTGETSLRLVDGVLMVQPKGTPVEAHDPATGARLWTWNGSWLPRSTGGGVLLLDAADNVHLVDPHTGLDRAKVPVGERSIVGASRTAVYTSVSPPAASAGLYRTSLRDGSRQLLSRDVDPSYVVEVGGTVVCIQHHGVSGLRSTDGQKLWSREEDEPRPRKRLTEFVDHTRDIEVIGQHVWMIDGYQVTQVDAVSGRIVSSYTLPTLDELSSMGLRVQLVRGQQPLIDVRMGRSGYWAIPGERPRFFAQPERRLWHSCFVGDTVLGMTSSSEDEPKPPSLTVVTLSDAGPRVPLPHVEPNWVKGATTGAAIVPTSRGAHDVSPENILLLESLQPGGPSLRQNVAGSYTLRYVPDRKGYVLLQEEENGAVLAILGIGYLDEQTAKLSWSKHGWSEDNEWYGWAFEIGEGARYIAFVAQTGWRGNNRRTALQVLDTVTDRLVTLGPPPPPIEKAESFPYEPPLKSWRDDRLDHVIELAPGVMSIKGDVLTVAYDPPGKKATRTRTWNLRRYFPPAK